MKTRIINNFSFFVNEHVNHFSSASFGVFQDHDNDPLSCDEQHYYVYGVVLGEWRGKCNILLWQDSQMSWQYNVGQYQPELSLLTTLL